MLRTAALLAAFAIVGTALVAITYTATVERIAENERRFLLQALHELVAPEMHDNDMYQDVIHVTAPAFLGTRDPVAVYRARRQNRPVAAVLTPVAPNGYNGRIKLLVAVDFNGVLLGVRVVSHKETPGLGDRIDVEKSDWIKTFAGKSLSHPSARRWRVKKDGGEFDQFTGATITPRAVVGAVRKTLEYFVQHRDALFAPIPQETDHHG
ncbi:MAG TPA: electron transport complex subunit RsxG [Gammaproteobacteria bacterium]|nr:electron transport complex subunit RsxG [Gammaproteobacteria bacterium]